MVVTWTLADAVALARDVERIAPRHPAHVALTGSCLFEEGPRPDVDLILYRVRQQRRIALKPLVAELRAALNLDVYERYGWVLKARLGERSVDLLLPDHRFGFWPFHERRSDSLSGRY